MGRLSRAYESQRAGQCRSAKARTRRDFGEDQGDDLRNPPSHFRGQLRTPAHALSLDAEHDHIVGRASEVPSRRQDLKQAELMLGNPPGPIRQEIVGLETHNRTGLAVAIQCVHNDDHRTVGDDFKQGQPRRAAVAHFHIIGKVQALHRLDNANTYAVVAAQHVADSQHEDRRARPPPCVAVLTPVYAVVPQAIGHVSASRTE